MYLWWWRTFGLLAKSLALLEGVVATASGFTCSIMVTIFQPKSKARLEKSDPAVEASRFGLRSSWSCSLPKHCWVSAGSKLMLLPATSYRRASAVARRRRSCHRPPSTWADSSPYDNWCIQRHYFQHRNRLIIRVLWSKFLHFNVDLCDFDWWEVKLTK